MKALDELREWTRNHTVNCSDNRIALVAIAERIDAEHKKAEDGWRAKDGQTWLKGYMECHAELTEGNETLASDLERCGWVRLPKDADGEYIRVGDAVTCVATVWTVTGLKFLGEGWSICCTVYNKHGGSGTTFYPPSDLRHYHPPTVEDILTEFHERMDELGTTDQCVGSERADAVDALLRERAELIAEYAAKLQLREDA